MAKKSREPRKQTRETKVEASFRPSPPLKAKNPAQAHYMDTIQESPITLATGYAGTGKTYIPARMAARWLKQSRVESIVLSRPAISESQSLGYFKGTVEEKMYGWLAPILGALKEEFSPGELDYLIKDTVQRITFIPLEVIKGYSLKNAFVIVDEIEDCTLKELKSITTRIGANSTMVLSGDITQSALDHSGVQQLLDMCAVDERLARHISHVAFNDASAIVRSDTCREIVLGFERAGK